MSKKADPRGAVRGVGEVAAHATDAVLRPVRSLLAFLITDEPPLELQILGRTLLLISSDRPSDPAWERTTVATPYDLVVLGVTR